MAAYPLKCPECGEDGFAPLPVADVTDKATFGCEVCGLKTKVFFIHSCDWEEMVELARNTVRH